jgi:CheY-like chemotaxis protein
MAQKLSLDVLVVEDEVETRSLLSQIFSQRGHRVRTAEDGFAALALIRESSPELILSDLNMPGMTGFELLSVVRRLHPGIYVIASSGAYSGTTVPQGIAADGFHEKATGVLPLIEMMEQGPQLTGRDAGSRRVPTPQWVSLQEDSPSEARHVFINCPDCLRPFRQRVEHVNAEIREAACRYCGGRVEFAVALAIKPAAPARCHAPAARIACHA